MLNYFSLIYFSLSLWQSTKCIYEGMDAQVAYGFHHLRNEKPYLAQGPISNKVKFIIPILSRDFYLQDAWNSDIMIPHHDS